MDFPMISWRWSLSHAEPRHGGEAVDPAALRMSLLEVGYTPWIIHISVILLFQHIYTHTYIYNIPYKYLSIKLSILYSSRNIFLKWIYIYIFNYIYIHAYTHTNIHMCVYMYIHRLYMHSIALAAHRHIHIYTRTDLFIFFDFKTLETAKHSGPIETIQLLELHQPETITPGRLASGMMRRHGASLVIAPFKPMGPTSKVQGWTSWRCREPNSLLISRVFYIEIGQHLSLHPSLQFQDLILIHSSQFSCDIHAVNPIIRDIIFANHLWKIRVMISCRVLPR